MALTACLEQAKGSTNNLSAYHGGSLAESLLRIRYCTVSSRPAVTVIEGSGGNEGATVQHPGADQQGRQFTETRCS